MNLFGSFWKRQFDEMSAIHQKTDALLEEALQGNKVDLKLIEKLLDEKEEWLKERESNNRRRETLVAESKR